MQKSVLASFAFLLLLLQGAQQSQGPGETCDPMAQNCDSGMVCDGTDTTCKIFAGGMCEGVEQWCMDHTFCDKDCLACKVKVGEACQVGYIAHCLEHATCNATSLICECDAGYIANDHNTECNGGLAGTVVSLTLMAVSLLASRLL